MKIYNCPDCELYDCEGCPRTRFNEIERVIPNYPKYQQEYIPSCCRGCSNHPINGGSGVCNCTAPMYDPYYPWKVTCSTSTITYSIE